MIDPHVHLRDWSQSEKETMARAFTIAWRAGISALFEMPNTDPPLTTRASVIRRLSDADRSLEDLGIPLFHAMYLGLTAEEGQGEEAVRTHGELFPRVVGFKLYAGHSTGRMGVTATEAQLRVWRTLARLNYRGVVAVHAEREDLLVPGAWDPDRPETHSLARPPLAEVASVQTQLALAEAAGFRGRLHICHASVADTVTLVRAEAPGLPFGVSLGVTPHHLLLTSDLARRSDIPEWNVNPPLRSEENRQALRQALLRGDIDLIESDHAPHTLADKKAGASGLPGLPAYGLLVRRLMQEGGGTDDRSLHALTTLAACRIFGIDPDDLPENPNSPFGPDGTVRRPGVPFDYREFAAGYPWDPYRFSME